MQTPPLNSPQKVTNVTSLRKHAIFGIGTLALLVGCLGGWMALTSIAGAVIANGMISVTGGSKRVQHPEGGIVREILVRDGSSVKAGDVLVRLDGVVVQSELSIVLSQLRDTLARQARLSAESTQSDSIVLPASAGEWPLDPELSELLGAQAQLRKARSASLNGRTDLLVQQIAQQKEQISGLLVQQDAVQRQINLLAADEQRLQALLGQGLMESSRVNQVRRDRAEMDGELGSVIAAIAAARASIAELEVNKVQLADDFQENVLQELAAVSQLSQELLQRKAAAEDRLQRLDIRAPTDGVVYESTVQTIGGIVNAGETIMQVVPGGNQLTLDVRISPLDIDKVFVGQPVQARLSGLDARVTPNLVASVNSISPDLSRDAASGVQFYAVSVSVEQSERTKLPQGVVLKPGMPAEVFMQTGDRTVLSYMLSPLTYQLGRALRE